MRRIVINSLLILLALFTTVPVFATEANYDSNGVTAFYGEYEYPKEDPEKEPPPIKKEETDKSNANEESFKTITETTNEVARTLPSYKGQEAILPATGDTSQLLTTLFGVALLVLFFFKLKEVENAEKNSIS